MAKRTVHLPILAAALHLHLVLEGEQRTAGGYAEHHRVERITKAGEIRAERRRLWAGKQTGEQTGRQRHRGTERHREAQRDYLRNPTGTEEGDYVPGGTSCTVPH